MKPFWRPAVAGAATLALGLAMAVAAALWQGHRNQAAAARAFDSLSQSLAAQVAVRIQQYERGLRGARGAVVAADGARIWREPFQRYSASRDIDREFPGARGFGIVWRVPQADEAAFVGRARRDGWPDFAVRQIEPHDGERFVIQYVEPVQRNREAVGLDIASETARRDAAVASMRSGEATLTSPITLVQATGKPQQSFLLMLPIYRPDAPTATIEQREAAAIGWSYAPLVIDEVLENLDREADHYTLNLRDAHGANTRSFYSSPGSDLPAAAGLQQHRSIDIFGRSWQADLRATPAFVASLGQTTPGTVALVVALISALSAAMVALRTRLAARNDAERVEQARRAAIVDASDDAIIGESLGGIVTDWNPGAERLFGHAACDALGRRVADLLLPAGREAEDAAICATLASGQRIAPFDTTRRHRDGSSIEVSISASPIMTADGRCIGLAMTVRDIRQARLAQRALAESNARLESQVAERTARLDTALHDLRAILDAVPSMIGYWDNRLVNRVANRAYSDWFGVDPQDLQGKTLQDLLGEALFERSRPFIEAALRGEQQTFERSTPQRNGKGMRHSLVHYLPDMVDGHVRGFYALVHDVTDLVEGRRKLAIAERDNEALLGTLHRHAIVSVADRHGRIIEVNDSFCAISGYRRDELIGQDHRILNSGTHEPAFWVDMWRTIASGAAWRAEVCNRAKDGSLYWVNSIVAPFIGADGKIEKYISIRNDVTAAKLTEQRLRSSEAFLDRAGRIAGVGGWEIDLANQQVHWSAQTYRIHEVEPGYIPTLSGAVDFYPPEARQVIEQAVAEGMQHGKPWDLELPLITAKGRSIWVRAVGAAERDEGKVVRLAGAFQDITARKEAEATLARERQLMNSLLDTLPDQIYFKDRDSRFLRINPALARRYGLRDPADALGKSDSDFFVESHAQRTTQIERQIIATAKPVVDLEEQELWPDREPTWNLTTKMPLYDEHRQVIGTFGISRDITQRKRIEEELQRTNTRFSLAADSVGLGVWEFDVVAGTLVWDERMYQLYGCESSSGAEPYTLWSRHLHPEDRVRSERELQDAIAGVRPFDTTFRIVLPNGDIRHLKACAHVVCDIEGHAMRMTGVNFDVSERVEAEMALQQRERMMRLVIDSFPGPLAHWDAQMRCTFANQAYQSWMGLDPRQMIGRSQRELFGDDVFLLNSAHMEAALLGEPQRIEREREFADGTRRSYLLHYVPDHDGEDVRGFISVVLDISPLKAVETQLRQAMHRANEANRAKSHFLANMSHEIRTPMNAVIGLSYLLERTRLDAHQTGMLGKIKVASKALLGIINDVLDLSKIEAGEMQVEHAPFSLPGLLRDLSELMSMQAQAKGIAFSIDAPADLPQALQGDATRLQQVLTNLLSNAIKFTAHGGVQLRVLCVQATPASVRLRFVAQDTGIGIAPDALERLFAPFVQADTSTTRRFGGTGLGLSIVKQLVTLMKGEIGVSSEPGVGSEFWAEVPFLLGQAALVEVDSGVVAGPGLQGVRVLIVDDSEINLEVAKNILQLEGARVSLATNGLQAVEYLQAHEAEIDIVLMDVQMPVLDGLEATRRIRSQLGLAELPIIGLTAGISNDEHQSAEAAGMNDVIGKPFDPRGLVRRMRRHVGASERVPDANRPEHSTEVPETWPRIEGIDARDAAMRLGGDVALFASMLKRLLRDFAGFEFDDTEAHALKTLASRMHSLKGSAGTLGAKDIERLASQAETASRANDGAQAAPLARRIAQALQALQQHAEPALAKIAAAMKHDDGVVVAPALDAQALAELLQQLRRAELGAMDRFAVLSPQLRGHLNNDTYQLLSEQIDNLQFDEALQTLEAHI